VHLLAEAHLVLELRMDQPQEVCHLIKGLGLGLATPPVKAAQRGDETWRRKPQTQTSLPFEPLPLGLVRAASVRSKAPL
jgi:hypothetical protein